MLNEIPKKRLIVYTGILGAIPFILILLHLMSQRSQLNLAQQQLQGLQEKAFIYNTKRAPNREIQQFFTNSDPLYLYKVVEPIRFLSPEIEELERLLKLDTLGVNENFRNRLDHLTSDDNRLAFAEGEATNYPTFKETVQTSSKPVELNLSDLSKVLSLIEGIPIGEYKTEGRRPQLFITDFKLSRKSTQTENEVYNLTLKLLKREYIAQ